MMNLNDLNIPFVFRGDDLIYPNYVKDGLVLHYDFSGMTNADTSRGIATDLSGNGNHGALQNFNYTAESGYDKNKLLFDGVDDGIFTPDSTDYNRLNSVTFEVLVSVKLSKIHRILDLNWSYISLAIFANYKINFNTGNLTLKDNYSNYIVKKDEVIHIVANYDEHTGDMYIYVNGVMDSHFKNSGTLGTYTNGLKVGTGHTSSQSQNGVIYSTRIYNRPLTPEEIAHNYAIEKERFGI